MLLNPIDNQLGRFLEGMNKPTRYIDTINLPYKKWNPELRKQLSDISGVKARDFLSGG
jgi:hypothetical protein